MAAVLFRPQPGAGTIFRGGFQVNTAIRAPFLNKLTNANTVDTSGKVSDSLVVITEVTIQNRDTIQYFLTFDDFISYYYFGKGLGSLSISGMILSDCSGYFSGAGALTSMIARIRGTTQVISFGNASFSAVISSFTIRAGDENPNMMDFNLQMDIINHSLKPPVFRYSC